MELRFIRSGAGSWLRHNCTIIKSLQVAKVSSVKEQLSEKKLFFISIGEYSYICTDAENNREMDSYWILTSLQSEAELASNHYCMNICRQAWMR